MTESSEPRQVNAPQSQGLSVTNQKGGETPTQNQYLQVDFGEQATKAFSWFFPTMVTLGIFCGFAVAFTIAEHFRATDYEEHLHDQMLRDQRSFEQMRVQVLSQNAIMLREGFIKPGDEWMGPEGNIQFNPKLIDPRLWDLKPRSK